MRRPRETGDGADRRGVILLVVLALLTLLAIVGLTFVLYADAQATAARIYRESQSAQQADVNPERLLAIFLNQLLYDVDDTNGIYSALRGHSLARTLYGYNDATVNDVPFNGMGRLHYDSPFRILSPPDTPASAQDDYNLINYTFFRDDRQMPPTGPFLRDPERLGVRSNPTEVRGPFTGGYNTPYTYPDLNNLFLAAVRADGTVLLPSFHRPWLFGSNRPAENTNWTNLVGKYLLLRPRPIDNGAGFPHPEEDGDVKNLVGSPGGNDSYLLDLDVPVLTGPDGSKFKPLFAPLVIDLDNRVNLNVHGNVRGAGGTHVSNQGFGPWEVNPRWLSGVPDPANPPDQARLARLRQEWAKVLLGNTSPAAQGRYGGQPWSGQPGTPGASPLQSAPPRPLPPFYSAFDFDACDEGPNGAVTAPIRVPGFGASSIRCFPVYPAGYGGGSPAERLAHPLLDNVAVTRGDHRIFPASDLEALLRPDDMGSPALVSNLLRICPQNFGLLLPAQAALRCRRLVTTMSADLDHPGVMPWIWDPAAQPYTLRAGDTQPSGSAIPSPSLTLPLSPPPPGSEFGSDWRAVDAALGRIDLNRPLPDYPAPDAATSRIRDLTAFQVAQIARTQLARDIYDRLRKVTGAADPTQAFVTGVAGQFNALRWLAQLAVNMVDTIDRDDYMTPFDWFTDPAGNKQWVFGTELPRLVVNEVYAEVANNPADPGPGSPKPKATLPFQVKFWVELHNPLFTDANLSDGGVARLQMPAAGDAPPYAVHRLIVAASPPLGVSGLRNPDRVLGDPDPGTTRLVVSAYEPEPKPVPQPLDGVDVTLVQPANGRYAGTMGGNDGFYLLGPKEEFPGTNPLRPQATLRVRDQVINGARSALTYDLPLSAPFPPRHTLLLQRLACPFLPPNPPPAGPVDPSLPLNPYVTIDYADSVAANDAVQADATGPHSFTPVAGRQSVGRNQPYAAHISQRRPQQPSPALPDQPQNTLFYHNAVELPPPLPKADTPGQTLKVPFDWLVHLDRPLISPMELLHVSAYKPHELTQQFCTFSGSFQHTADWWNSQRRLYRIFEFLETHALAAGVPSSPGGRIPGKININTIWDPETLLSLCDPQTSNNFSAGDLYLPLGIGPGFDYVNHPQSLYWRLMAARTPNLLTGGGLGPDDRPLLGGAAGATPPGDPQYPQGGGIERTLLRSFDGSGSRRLFQPPDAVAGNHPYLRDQLLTKVFNHLTTRSNVFAVWLTVGFFEVTDETTRPVKLGAEIGRSEGRHIRHRMFAIVDRSELAIVRMAAGSAVAVPGAATVRVAATSGIGAGGQPWSISVGCTLAVDTADNEESVVVTDVTPTTFTATFTRPHDKGFVIRRRGNPGPQPDLDLPARSEVVPYYSIIK